ncbi:MAG: thiamine phosphate synthase [Oceanococcus sp.]
MSRSKQRLKGLYLLADESALAFEQWPCILPSCLDAGVSLVQYRGKQLSKQQQQDHAGYLLGLCRERNIPLLINDDLALCLSLGADGVHLGHSDGSLEAARNTLGSELILGCSCYNELARAQAAYSASVDYVSFGRFFPSATKPSASPADLSVLTRAAQHLDTAVCAIGGITPDNALRAVEAGADLICVAGGVFNNKDPAAACAKLATIAR